MGAGNILIVLSAALGINVCAVMVRRIRSVVLRDAYRELFGYELAACAVLLLFSLDVRFGFLTKPDLPLLRAAGWMVRTAAALVTAVLLVFFARITAGCLIRSEGNADYALVLGMALENGKPTADLLSRLHTAESFLRKNPDAVLILTGGNPDASGRTEAAVMQEILLGHGVDRKRMILEDGAEDTKQNFLNSAALISPGKPVVLISSGYHMDRAVRTAKSAGFSKVLRLPAPSSPLDFAANVVSEALLELNELTIRK